MRTTGYLILSYTICPHSADYSCTPKMKAGIFSLPNYMPLGSRWL